MAKRISRRELKERIKNLSFALRNEEYRFDSLNDEHEELKKRFRELGSHMETYDVRGNGIECIDIKPEPWGQYARISDKIEITDDILESIKNRVVSQIARGLMDKDLVQFIVHDHDIFPDQITIGAKLWVVPWEKMVSKIIIKK